MTFKYLFCRFIYSRGPLFIDALSAVIFLFIHLLKNQVTLQKIYYFYFFNSKIHTMRKIALILVSLILLTVGCNDDKRNEPINPAFIDYISGFTSGIISNQSTIKISLAEPSAHAQYDKAIDDDLFDFSPEIEGEAYWVDETTIEFRPESRLPSNTYYKAEFYLSELVEVEKDLETFYFDFETYKQGVNLQFSGVKAYDNNSLKWQQITYELTTADFANAEDLEKTISATQNGKN